MRISEILKEVALNEKFKLQRKGSKGPAVKEMQKMLISLGHLNPTWTSKRSGKKFPSDDGNFGSGTLKAVKAFQEAEGLTVDGLVGNKTIMAMRKIADREERGAMDIKKAGVDDARADYMATVRSVLQKRQSKKIADLVDQKLSSKMRNPEMYDDMKALIAAKADANVSGKEFGKLARQYINKDLAMYVSKLDFRGAMDFMLQKTTMMTPPDRKSLLDQVMTMRNEILSAKKASPDAAVAKHGDEKQKAKMAKLNKDLDDIEKREKEIDNRTLDGVPVGQQAKKDFEKKVTPRTPYAMAKGNVG